MGVGVRGGNHFSRNCTLKLGMEQGVDLSGIPRKEFESFCLPGPSKDGGRGAHLQLAGAAVLDERRESCQLQLGVRL